MAAPTNIWYTDIGAPMAGNVNVLANLVDPNLSAGRLQQITAVYTMTGNEVANDAIYIMRLPGGSIVNPIDGNIAAEAVATTATVSVGDTDTNGGVAAYNPARYSAALNVAAGNTTVGFPFTGGPTLLTPVEVVDDWVWLLATFATLSVPVAGKKLIFRIKVAALD